MHDQMKNQTEISVFQQNISKFSIMRCQVEEGAQSVIRD